MRFVNCLWCIICYCIYLSISSKIQFSEAKEYLIRSGQIPSYLEASFKYVDDHAFPAKLSINMSITKFAGTLLHTIDHRNNEVSILLSKEGNDQFFNVSLNANSAKINSTSLCNCVSSCTSMLLVLTVRTDTAFSLQCNQGLEDVQIFQENGKPKNDFQLRKERNVKGIIWMVNTPNFGNLHSNVYQMEGRIFNVEYNGNSVKLKRFGDAIVDLSKVACNDGMVCNGGICHETHADEPLCDCTKIFGSGRRCLDESRTINRKFNSTFQFGGIKISWRSESSSIFEIGNERRKLQVKKESKNLMFLSKADKIEASLTNDYDKNKNYVLLISFEEANIKIELINNSITTRSTSLNLNQEMFDYMTLSSGEGVIDVAYKINMSEQSWKKLEVTNETSESLNSTDAENNKSTDFTETTSPQILLNASSNFVTKPTNLGPPRETYIISVLLLIICLMVLTFVRLYRKRKKNVINISSANIFQYNDNTCVSSSTGIYGVVTDTVYDTVRLSYVENNGIDEYEIIKDQPL